MSLLYSSSNSSLISLSLLLSTPSYHQASAVLWFHSTSIWELVCSKLKGRSALLHDGHFKALILFVFIAKFSIHLSWNTSLHCGHCIHLAEECNMNFDMHMIHLCTLSSPFVRNMLHSKNFLFFLLRDSLWGGKGKQTPERVHTIFSEKKSDGYRTGNMQSNKSQLGCWCVDIWSWYGCCPIKDIYGYVFVHVFELQREPHSFWHGRKWKWQVFYTCSCVCRFMQRDSNASCS